MLLWTQCLWASGLTDHAPKLVPRKHLATSETILIVTTWVGATSIWWVAAGVLLTPYIAEEAPAPREEPLPQGTASPISPASLRDHTVEPTLLLRKLGCLPGLAAWQQREGRREGLGREPSGLARSTAGPEASSELHLPSALCPLDSCLRLGGEITKEGLFPPAEVGVPRHLALLPGTASCGSGGLELGQSTGKLLLLLLATSYPVRLPWKGLEAASRTHVLCSKDIWAWNCGETRPVEPGEA